MNLNLKIAWFNKKHFSIRVVGKYEMVCPTDPLWKALNIQSYIDAGLVLPDDFDKELSNTNIIEDKEVIEREWRNSELKDADILFNIAMDDGKNTTAISAYRKALRDYPANDNFPNGKRPLLNDDE